MLALQMLGTPSLQRDGRAVSLPARKLLALLMLLALASSPLPRGRVVAVLWPMLDETTGRRNLRRELARLREVGAGDAVQVDGDTLALGASVSCDTVAFTRACQSGQHDAALALWRGPPADGFVLGDADAFDDWLAQRCAELVERRRQALQASAAARETAADFAGALARIETLLADDPLQEQHHRDAMRLLAATGRREAALAQYERCRVVLRAELGLSPMAETEALAEALRGAPLPKATPKTALSGERAALLPEQLPFVGRNNEVAQLELAWRTGRPIVIEGEGGVGKTRLALDFAAAHGPYALARCRSGDAELPYASFGRALRALMGPAPALPELPAWVGNELARLLPALGTAPPPIHSDEERNRFFEACARGWQALSADSFDAVVLDDWHLADAASRALLGFIAKRRSEEAAPGAREVLLLRPDLEAAAGDALRSLVEATGAAHLRLQGLAGDAVLDLVRRLSGAGHPVRFAARLDRATRGNPFFLAETLRHLVETELLSTGADGGWQTPFDDATQDYRELPVPSSVLDTVLARVARLAAATRRVLEAAALAAEPFAPALLAPACALSELDTVLAIEEAVAAKLLREHEAGGFAFAHDLVQQALTAALSAERRRLVHRRLALGAEAAGAPAATIASHHEASGDAARAVGHRLVAGDRAQDMHALDEAIGHWNKALAGQPAPALAIALHQRISWAAQQRSEIDRVQAQADALASLLERASLTWRERVDASIVRARSLTACGRAAEALPLLDGLTLQDASQQAGFLRARACAMLGVGRSAEALVDAESALALTDVADIDRVEMLDLAFLCDHNAGRIAAALGRADAMLALSQRIGFAHGVARARYRRGIELVLLDDLGAAEAALQTAVDECERIGFVNLARVALYNLKCVYSTQGRHAQALAAVARGWAMQPPVQAGDLRAMYRLAMLDAQVALGDFGAAWRVALLAVDDILGPTEPPIRMAAVVCALEPLALLGEAALARRLLAAVDDAAAGQLVNAASEMWVALAQFELAEGDPVAAERALARLDAAGGLVEERVRVRYGQARAALALAQGDAPAALTLLPADDTVGMNDEMRTRGLALRVAAEAKRGGLAAATVAAVQASLAAPPDHHVATLELHAALARAAAGGVAQAPSSAPADHAAFVSALAETLREHPVQQAGFRHANR